jgi:hypothetical protein
MSPTLAGLMINAADRAEQSEELQTDRLAWCRGLCFGVFAQVEVRVGGRVSLLPEQRGVCERCAGHLRRKSHNRVMDRMVAVGSCHARRAYQSRGQ